MWSYKIINNTINIYENGVLKDALSIRKSRIGYWIGDSFFTILRPLFVRSYRVSHNLSLRGDFPYHETIEDLKKTIETFWLEQHAQYFVEYEVRQYSNIIKFTIDNIDYKFRIKWKYSGYVLNPTKGSFDDYKDILFNLSVLKDNIGWKDRFYSKEELLRFIHDYQRKALIYKSL